MTGNAIERTELDGNDMPELPLWSEDLRGAPAMALRSAFFATIQPDARTFLQREQIAAVGDLRIIYTGFRLDQADFDVYEQVLHMARQALGQPVKFKTREMLRAIGRSEGKSDRDWLLKSLSRLIANEIEVTKGSLSYAGSLIHEQGRDAEAGMHYVVLNPKIAAVFAQGWSELAVRGRLPMSYQSAP